MPVVPRPGDSETQENRPATFSHNDQLCNEDQLAAAPQVPPRLALRRNNIQILQTSQNGRFHIELGVSTSLPNRPRHSEAGNSLTSRRLVVSDSVRCDDSNSEPEYDFCSIARLGHDDTRQGRDTNRRRAQAPVVNIAIVVNNTGESQNRPCNNLQVQNTEANLDQVNGILNFEAVTGFLGYLRHVIHESFTGTLIELLKGWVLNNLQS